MIWVILEDTLVGFLCRVEVFLQFVNVTDLEMDVTLDKWSWWVAENKSKALKTLLKLLLLFINYSESKVNLVGLLKLRVHLQHSVEGLLCVIEGTIAVIKDTNAIPQSRILGIRQMVKSLLVGRVGFLKVVHHEVAVAQCSPYLSVGAFNVQDPLKIFHGLGVLLPGVIDGGSLHEGLEAERVVAQRVFVAIEGLVHVVHKLPQLSHFHPTVLICPV